MDTSGKHTGPWLKTSARGTKGRHRIWTPRPALHPQEACHSVPSHGCHVPPAATTGQAQAHPSTGCVPSCRATSRLRRRESRGVKPDRTQCANQTSSRNFSTAHTFFSKYEISLKCTC